MKPTECEAPFCTAASQPDHGWTVSMDIKWEESKTTQKQHKRVKCCERLSLGRGTNNTWQVCINLKTYT